MKKFMSVLLILIGGLMACNDNVYEDFDNGMIVRCKELRDLDDISPSQPWIYEYNIRDYSSRSGNTPGDPGDFYLYSSINFSVGDTLTFTTMAILKSFASLKEQLLITTDSLREQIAFSKAELQKSKNLNEKNIKLQAEVNITTAKNQKLTKFKNDLKKLVVVTDFATP